MPGDLPETWPRKQPRSALPARRFLVENGRLPGHPLSGAAPFLGAARVGGAAWFGLFPSGDRVTRERLPGGVGPRRVSRRPKARPDHDNRVAPANVGSCVVRFCRSRDALRRRMRLRRRDCDRFCCVRHCIERHHRTAHLSGAPMRFAQPVSGAETCLPARGARYHLRNTATMPRRLLTGVLRRSGCSSATGACSPQRCF